jgi:hypothetical protein
LDVAGGRLSGPTLTPSPTRTAAAVDPIRTYGDLQVGGHQRRQTKSLLLHGRDLTRKMSIERAKFELESEQLLVDE